MQCAINAHGKILKGEKELKEMLQLLRFKLMHTFYNIAISRFSAMHFFYFTGYLKKQRNNDIAYPHMGMYPYDTQSKIENIIPDFPHKASGILYTLQYLCICNTHLNNCTVKY